MSGGRPTDAACADGTPRRKGLFRRRFPGPRGVPLGQTDDSQQDPRAFDAAGVQHGFSPLVCLGADGVDLHEQIAGAMFDATDLLGAK